MPQEQPQYYRAVKASEPPKNPDIYHTLIENESLDIEGIPCHNNYIGTSKGGYWEIDGEAKVTHYLEPIPIPDTERLREALENITKSFNATTMHRIAREALSAVGDGWIRVEEKKFIQNKMYMLWGDDWQEPTQGSYWSYEEDEGWHTPYGDNLFLVTHHRPLPSPPLNK